MTISIHPTGAGPSILGHIGTVEDVIAARLPEEMTSRRFSASDFKAGFELATPKELSSMGEALLVNGFCFTTSTDRDSEEYNRTIHGKEFTSGGMFLIPKEAKASHLVGLQGEVPMIDFYNTVYKVVKRPLAFAGLFHFSDFHGVAIGKPPIDGKNIFNHKEEYYPNAEVRKKNVYGFVMGALTDFQGYLEINNEMKTVLYKNPMDAGSLLTHHAHVVLLKKRVETWEEIHPSLVDQTLHLFIDGTALKSGKAEVFMAAGVKNYLKEK